MNMLRMLEGFAAHCRLVIMKPPPRGLGFREIITNRDPLLRGLRWRRFIDHGSASV